MHAVSRTGRSWTLSLKDNPWLSQAAIGPPGIHLQNTIAARYLGSMRDSSLPDSERVVEIRGEAPGPVNDIVMICADGCPYFIHPGKCSMPKKPVITATTHVLHYGDLAPVDFERLCLWLVDREGYERSAHLGAAGGEQGRDIVAWKEGRRIAFQCKRVKSFGPQDALKEVNKLLELPQEDRPTELIFIVTCDVSVDARSQACQRCEPTMKCEFWASTEFDAKVKRYPDIVQEFFQQLDGKEKQVPRPFQAPPLPAYYVSRANVIDDLRNRLLAEATVGTLPMTAVHGMGASGKTTIAAAIAYELREHFTDGVLWVEVGQRPQESDLQAKANEWISALGGSEVNLRKAFSCLRDILIDKSVLLVVDNVWETKDAKPFLVGGPKCHVLITTRLADVVEDSGSYTYELPDMTRQQSFELLERRLDRKIEEAERSDAELLITAVGSLPLALVLTAVRVSRGASWSSLNAALGAENVRWQVLENAKRRRKRKEEDKIEQEADPRLLGSLSLSLNWLRKDDPEAWEAFIWLGVLVQGVRINAQVVSLLWNVDKDLASDLLELLSNDSLLIADARITLMGESLQSYRLHDLFHDLARTLLINPKESWVGGELPGLGLTMPQAHARLIERYRQRCGDGKWHALPDDGYVFSHLAWHMLRAGQEGNRYDDLYRLINKDKGWMFAKLAKFGSPQPFAADIDLAIQGANLETPRNIVQVICNCLISATLVSQATSVPPKALAVLTRCGQVEKALGYAALMQQSEARNNAYLLIGKVLLDHDRSEHGNATARHALRHALAAVHAIPNELNKARALNELADAFAQAGDREGLTRALAVAKAVQDEVCRDVALFGTAFLAMGVTFSLARMGMYVEALREVQGIQYESHRAGVLAVMAWELANVGDEEGLKQALAVAQAIEDQESREKALAGVKEAQARIGAQTKEKQTAVEVSSVSRSIEDEPSKYEELAAISSTSSHVDDKIKLRQDLTAAQAIQNEAQKAEALTGVARALAEAGDKEGLKQALMAAQAIQGETWKAEALAGVAQALAEAGDKEGLKQAFTAVQAIQNAKRKFHALGVLAECMAKVGLQTESMVAVQAIQDEADKGEESLVDVRDSVSALVGVAQALAEAGDLEGLKRTLSLAQAIEKDGDKASEVVKVVARALAKAGMQTEALAAVQTIHNEGARAEALTQVAWALAKAGDKNGLKRVLAEARSIKDVESRAKALASVADVQAQMGNQTEALRIVSEAISTVQVIENGEDEIESKIAVARALAQVGKYTESLSVACATQDEKDKAYVLVTIALALTNMRDHEGLKLALLEIQSLKDAEIKKIALAELVDKSAKMGAHVDVEQGTVVTLSTAEANPLEESRVWLKYFAEELDKGEVGQELNQTLAVVQAINDEEIQKSVWDEVQEPSERKIEARRLQSEWKMEAGGMYLDLTFLPISDMHMCMRLEVLAGLARGLAKVGMKVDASRAAAVVLLEAEATRDIFCKATALAEVVGALTQLRDLKGLKRVLVATRAIPDEWYKAQTLARVAEELRKIGASEGAQRVCAQAFMTARLAGRETVFIVLKQSVDLLKEIRNGEALWQIYRAIQPVNSWWDS
jgi:hypothetical protein